MTDVRDAFSQLLGSVHAVLFDFDGPLCDVFAGLPAPGVARGLERIVGLTLPTDDPLEVLKYAAECAPGLLESVESALVSAEVNAVQRSATTNGALAAIDACLSVGRKVGVVSNNSGDAVRIFLSANHLDHKVGPVVGRVFARPSLMKPNPWPLMKALELLGLSASDVVFVGDSVSDLDAADAAGITCVAYANKPGKREAFSRPGVFVIDHMQEITDSLNSW